ncbi:hypothetical protein BURKHO8Y_340008 [Burkholderia sp. 8Y]|nr:hypothetical protein BURKHO8Y_340008 [Burkholderia sp. 8Y]
MAVGPLGHRKLAALCPIAIEMGEHKKAGCAGHIVSPNVAWSFDSSSTRTAGSPMPKVSSVFTRLSRHHSGHP